MNPTQSVCVTDVHPDADAEIVNDAILVQKRIAMLSERGCVVTNLAIQFELDRHQGARISVLGFERILGFLKA